MPAKLGRLSLCGIKTNRGSGLSRVDERNRDRYAQIIFAGRPLVAGVVISSNKDRLESGSFLIFHRLGGFFSTQAT